MPRLLLTLVPLAAACGTCPAEPEVTDERGPETRGLGLDALADAYADFQAWSGGGRVCIDEVRIRGIGPTVVVHRRLAGDPDLTLGWRGWMGSEPLFWGMCLVLDRSEELSRDRRDLFKGRLDARHEAFADACSQGPLDDVWQEQALSACGSVELDEARAFAADAAFPFGPAPRVDGALHAAWGEPVRAVDVESGDWHVLDAVRFGDDLALLRTDEVSRAVTVERLDLQTGALDTIAEQSLREYGWAALLGGDAAVLLVSDSWAEYDLTLLDPAGPDAHLVGLTNYDWSGEGAVSGGWLAMPPAGRITTDLSLVELSTGQLRTVPLPTEGPPPKTLVSDLAAVPGGFVMRLTLSTSNSSWPVVGRNTVSTATWRYEPATDIWTELLDDTRFHPAGTTATGLVLGGLFGSGPELLAGYDPDGDRLLVSGDFCLDDAELDLVASDRAWVVDKNGADVVATPLDWWE